MEPIFIEYQELEQIADGFSEKRKLGEGGYGKVYWGVRENGDQIAVKMLRDNFVLDDNEFQNEFGHHFKLKHDNIVRLVGFCHESKGRDVIEHEGKFVIPEKRYRILCFEYMPNGSLQMHLCDESDRLNWHTSYKIIKGTCEGLKYLHNRAKPILHLDLKPENILLDKNMVAKLADFGLSKNFDDKKTKITRNVKGTPNDIFSLGVVIIEIMMGPTGYSQFKEMSSREDNEKIFIDLRLPVVKLGMWGGNEGSYYDLDVMPRRLLTVTIRFGRAIDSIAFSYIGIDLNEHMAGPWGGPYGGHLAKIILGPNEIVKKISGTHADYETATDVIRSLAIVTNVKTYSFGEATGNPFRICVENNGHIISFYARSKGWLLNAIGIYVHP